jgi:DNA-binding PadR family transcriptional regulator
MRSKIGFATAAVFGAVERGNKFGLDIMRETGMPSGTVYPTLTRAETAGLVRSRWEATTAATAEGRPRRRYYELTAAGRASLTEAMDRFGQFAESHGRKSRGRA